MQAFLEDDRNVLGVPDKPQDPDAEGDLGMTESVPASAQALNPPES